MEIITKIITGLGGVGTVTGLFWIWTGAVDFIQGRKNKDKQRQDDGSDSMTNGVYLAIASAGIAAAIPAEATAKNAPLIIESDPSSCLCLSLFFLP